MGDEDVQYVPVADADRGKPVAAIAMLLVIGMLIAPVVVVVLQNPINLPVNFLWWSFSAPSFVLYAGAAVSGVLIRWIIGFVRNRRKRA